MPHPLILRANVEGWRAFTARREQESFKKNAPKIWQRDNYRCQFCGYQAKKFQEIVNLDGNYRNNVPQNLTTACVLCAHCQFIGAPDLGHRLILFPALTQAQLSHMYRVWFCVIETEGEMAETAKILYRNMYKYTDPVEAAFGKDTSEFDVFGQCVLDTHGVTDEKYAELSKYLRVLPNMKQFPKQIKYWARSMMPDLLTLEE